MSYKIRIPAWSITFAIACIFGLVSKQMEAYAVLVIIAIASALYDTEKKYAHPAGRVIAGIIVLFASYGLRAHAIP
ncbi:hypothetical protein [Sporomusa sp. KB1]|uniref:hypothetical protein n=1 Tax=Sporomusa sp. KB1 TaxID=943346 RepID=UPI001C94F314|nr:hypothetical protein [Sporomusa sp. KB1]